MSHSRLIDSPSPIVAAPMAGGPTTVALASAAIDSGAFAFLAAGYKSVETMASEIRAVRAAGDSFGVNLFVPSPSSIDATAYSRYRDALRPEALHYGIELPESPHADDDEWDAKVVYLLAEPVPAVSFTFGLPPADVIARLRRVGTMVLATVTMPAEARAAEEAGVDGVIVQGPAAGGHSATFEPRRAIVPISTGELVEAVQSECSLPIIATGGVDGPRSVQRLLATGAESVAVGTLLLRTDEAGTSGPHRAALTAPAFTSTVLTHAFTGRPARALQNTFTERYTAVAPFGYPELHHLTRALRQAASRAGDTSRMHLWAGTGHRAARTGPVGAVIRSLLSESADGADSRVTS